MKRDRIPDDQLAEHDKVHYELLKSLLRRRDALGLSNAEISRRMGVSPSVAGNLLRGIWSPELGTIVRLAWALDAKVEIRLLVSEV